MTVIKFRVNTVFILSLESAITQILHVPWPKLLLGQKAELNFSVVLNSCHNRVWHFHTAGRKLSTKSLLWWHSDNLNNRHHLNYYPEDFGICNLLWILWGIGKDGYLFICKYCSERLYSTSFSSVLAMNMRNEKNVNSLFEIFLKLYVNTGVFNNISSINSN